VPTQGSFVLIANHASDLDPPALAAALSWRRLQRLYWSGDAGRLFVYGLQRLLARAMHVFPVDERSPASTLGGAKTVLERGAALCWFPESWRSPTGELQPFRPGIGYILSERPVTVVPAYIKGTFEAMPRTSHWPRPHPISITFGRPIPGDHVQNLVREPDGVERIVSLLHDEVAALEQAAHAPISKAAALD
jgi:long-chain acyl-CoA synthetase